MAQNEIDERLEALKQRSGEGGEERPPEADDLSAAVAEDFANHNGEAASEEAFTSGEETPSAGLLSFYDRLRDRIVDAVERRGGKLGPAVVKALLLVPDVFILMVRLTLDREVPGSARAMIGGALAYFILPIDLLPEAVIGAGGYLDDLVLASAVLAQTFSGELEPYARKHWSGREDLRKVLADVAEAAQGLLGHDMYGRVRKLLGKRGIRVED
jgi:uncharacterized membrane protein YkvA (DUF1232 family)